MGPPANFVGAVCPLGLILARTDRLAVVATAADVYPTGWVIEISVRYAGDDDLLVSQHHVLHSSLWDAEPTEPEAFSYGIEFFEGDRWEKLQPPQAALWARPLERSPGPLVQPCGATGTRSRLDLRAWLHPLPSSEGKVAVSCRWLGAGIPLSRSEFPAERIVGAASQAVRLWDGEPPDGNQLWLTISS